MAENKKSFVLYADLLRSIEHLTNEEKGILFNHLLEYVNDKNPVLEDRLLITAWKPIETQLKRDLIKFEETKENRSINGRLGNLKRWNFDLYTKVIENQIDIKEAEAIANSRKLSLPDSELSQTVANVADNVNVNDSVNDSVNVNENKNENKYINKNIYRKFEHLKISFEEVEKLKADYDIKAIDSILDKIENYKNNKKYKSLYLTAKEWLKKENKNKDEVQTVNYHEEVKKLFSNGNG